MKALATASSVAGGANARKKTPCKVAAHPVAVGEVHAVDGEQLRNLLHGHVRFATSDQFCTTPAPPKTILPRMASAMPRRVSSVSKYKPLVPSLERATDGGGEQRSLNASTVVISGLAAPLRICNAEAGAAYVDAAIAGQSCAALPTHQ